MSAETPSTPDPQTAPETAPAPEAAPAPETKAVAETKPAAKPAPAVKAAKVGKAISVTTELPAMPPFNFEALFTMQKAQVDTFVAAQQIIIGLATDLGNQQQARIKETTAKAEAMLKDFGTNKEPTAYALDAKAVFEDAMSDARETMDLGLKAQNQMIELLTKRVAATVEAAKSLTA